MEPSDELWLKAWRQLCKTAILGKTKETVDQQVASIEENEGGALALYADVLDPRRSDQCKTYGA